MIDGYYLSTYFDVHPVKNTLDIRQRHDHAMALWLVSDEVLTLRRYWEFERISGLKQHATPLYDNEAARKLMTNLLEEEGLSLGDIQAVWGSPAVSTDYDFARGLDTSFAIHGMAHLLTALYFRTPEPRLGPWRGAILGLSMDGAPDTLFEPDARMRHYYPGCYDDGKSRTFFDCESPARLWQYAKTKYGMREGTLMALATASTAEVHIDLSEFADWRFHDVNTRIVGPRAVELIANRVDEAIGLDQWKVPPANSDLPLHETRLSAIMKGITDLSVDIASRNIEYAIERFGITPRETQLAMAGGFALNCPTNSRLIEKYNFGSHQIPPCASDSGIALGAGLVHFYPALAEGRIKLDLAGPYAGQGYGDLDAEIEQCRSSVESVELASTEEIVQTLASEGIVCWVTGNAEIGPRALGNRSLIADPRTVAVKDRLNRIKHREWWRPVAPVVLHEFGTSYFEDYAYSPFMTLNFRARERTISSAPAVVHLDGTARVQSVSRESNSVLHGLLTGFAATAGVHVLGNTSLNDAGEPIINRLSQAIQFAAGKAIRTVVVDGRWSIKIKDRSSSYHGPSSRSRSFFDPPSGVDREQIRKTFNPHGLSRRELAHFWDEAQLRDSLDPSLAADASTIRSRTAEHTKKYPGALDRG